MDFEALPVQLYYDASDWAVVQMIPEKLHLQYFCGMTKHDSKQPPFDSSTLVHSQKRLGLDLTNVINELIIIHSQKCLPTLEYKHQNESDVLHCPSL